METAGGYGEIDTPGSRTAALMSLGFRDSLPPSETLTTLFNEHTGPTSRKNTFAANFTPGLPFYSADAHNTYEEQEIEEEEEVLGDF